MSIYRLGWVDGYNKLGFKGEKAYDVFAKLFDGTPRAAQWKPAEAVVAKAKKKDADFPYLNGHIPVVSEKAWKALGPLIGKSVEALPITGTATPYWALNVLDVADVLDEKRSDLERFDDGVIMIINRYAFKPGAVKGNRSSRSQTGG